MLKNAFALAAVVSLALASQGSALADDWTGQSPPSPEVGPIGPVPSRSLRSIQTIIQNGNYEVLGDGTLLPAVPAAAQGSDVGVLIEGFYPDEASPTGISLLTGKLPLSAFARSATVDALTTNINAMSSQLQSLSIQFNQLQQQTQFQDRDLRQGVAMSLAMDGVGDLGPDEHVAISMNFGTFGGQNGMAAGIAFRASDHLTVNGGIGTGMNGGLVGGRVGARLAW